jgi:hypothetical protein
MTVDFGYAHLFVSDAPINRTSALQDKLVGTFKNQIDILSAQVGWNFLAIACHSDQLKQTWTSIALAPKHGGLGSGRRATKITSPYCPLGGEGQNILKRYTVSLSSSDFTIHNYVAFRIYFFHYPALTACRQTCWKYGVWPYVKSLARISLVEGPVIKVYTSCGLLATC